MKEWEEELVNAGWVRTIDGDWLHRKKLYARWAHGLRLQYPIAGEYFFMPPLGVYKLPDPKNSELPLYSEDIIVRTKVYGSGKNARSRVSHVTACNGNVFDKKDSICLGFKPNKCSIKKAMKRIHQLFTNVPIFATNNKIFSTQILNNKAIPDDWVRTDDIF